MSTLSSRAAFCVLAPMTLILAACSGQEGEAAGGDLATQENMARTVATMMAGDDELSMTSEALSQTGLSTMLDGPSSYTVIAPVDAAFENLEGSEALLEDGTQAPLLAAMLREHIIPGALTPETIRTAIEQKGGPVEMRTLGSGTLTFDEDGEQIVMTSADGATAHLASAAMVASNGVLFPVDGVLAELPATQ